MHLNNNAFYLAAMHLTVKICIMQKLNPENMNLFFQKRKIKVFIYLAAQLF